jgi:glycosyltransferase involved in cell wall biosynthesis
MKFLMVHNDYGAPSGEEIQFYLIKDLLERNGHEVRVYSRSSAEIPAMALGKLRAFCAGIYNPFSRKHVAALIAEFRPDAVLVKNLFPFISPAILPVCRRMGVPVIMCVANYRLMCPNGLHMNKGRTCEKCLGGREYNCVINNCEGSLFKSTGYALRSGVARVAGFYRKNVTAYVCASRFLRQRMIDAGFDADRLHLIPNVVPEQPTIDESNATPGEYVGYVGRISREKGVHVLLDAAAHCPQIKFKLAGRVADDFPMPNPLPPNVELVGFIERERLADFYRGARFMLSTSECFETFGMSVGEALQHGRTVIASRIGVFPEFVQDGVTGLLFESGNADDLKQKIEMLWAQPQRCVEMGRAGRQWARQEYSPQMYYSRLINVCRAVVGDEVKSAA